MTNTSIIKILDNPSKLIHCIATEHTGNVITRPIKTALSSILTAVNRAYYRIFDGKWFTNEAAKEALSYYLFSSAPSEKTTERSKNAQRIFQAIIQASGKKEIEGLDKAAIDELTDPLTTSSDEYYHSRDMVEPSTKLLFHIHADEFGSNNHSLEGLDIYSPIEYVVRFLKTRNTRYGLSDDVIEQLEKTLSLKNAPPCTLQEEIKRAFEQKKPFLLPGGWTGRPHGHGMFYEIVPTSRTEATFRIYNLGGGSSYHHQGPPSYKTKVSPYIDFTKVKKECLNDINTLTVLHELQNDAFYPDQQHKNEKTEFNADDIYQGLRNLLNPETITHPDIGTIKPKTAQRSGICAWRSLEAFLSVHMEEKQYKKFIVDIKLQSLVGKTSFIAKKSLSKTDVRLIQKAHERLARKIVRAHKKNEINDTYLVQASVLLQKVNLWLQKNKSLLFTKEKTIKDVKTYASSTFLPYSTLFNTVPLVNIITTSPPETHQPCSFLYENTKDLTINDISKLKNIITLSMEKGEYQAVYTTVFEFISKAPINIETIQKAYENAIEAEKNLEDLGEIAKIFFKTCAITRKETIGHPEMVYVLLKTLYIQKILFHIKHPSIPSLIGSFYGDPFSKNDPLLFDLTGLQAFCITVTNAHLNEEFHHLCTLLTLPIGTRAVHETPTFSPLNVSTYYFAIDLTYLFANEYEAMQQENPNFKQLKRKEQCAAMFASDHLPQSIKAIRDTYTYLNGLSIFSCRQSIDDSISFEAGAYPSHNKEVTTCMIKSFCYYWYNDNTREDYYANTVRRISDVNLRSILEMFRNYSLFSSLDLSSEKKIATIQSSKHNITFSDEFCREILHIWVNPKYGQSTTIVKTIEYFIKHPEKLRDPDYQIFFQLFLFSNNRLEEEFKVQGFAKKLQTFVESLFYNCLETNEIQTAVFLLRMDRLFSHYSDSYHMLATHERFQLLLHQATTIEEKSVIYAENVAFFSQKKSPLSDDEVKSLLIGTTFLQRNPVCNKWKNPDTEQEIAKSLHIHTWHIHEALSQDPQRYLEAILHALEINESHTWKIVQKPDEFLSFVSDDNSLLYFPLQAMLVTNKYPQLLPFEIREHSNFKKILINISCGKLRNDGIYECSDNGIKTYIQLDKDNRLHIEQQRNGNWYRFIPEETIKEATISDKPHPLSLYMKEQCTHWLLLQPNSDSKNKSDDTILSLIDTNSKKEKYQLHISPDRKITKIIDIDTNLCLKPPSDLFDRFEKGGYVHNWYKKNSLSSIELPRFNLSFEKKGSNFLCNQFPSFFVSQDQTIPYLGSFAYYLVLENSKGEKKILIPKQKFLPPKEFESLLPAFERDQQLSLPDGEKQYFALYNVKQDGTLTTQSKSDYLFLANVLTLSHEYENAAIILKKQLQTVLPYTEEEEKRLLDLISTEKITGDCDPSSFALRTFAGYLYIRNLENHHKRPKKEDISLITTNMKEYLGRYKNITTCKIKEQDEEFLISYLLGFGFDTQLYMRLNELNHSSAPDYIPPCSSHCLSTQPFTLPTHIPKETKESEKMLLTRLTTYAEENFPDLYDIARNGNEAKRAWLETGLSFAKHQTQNEWTNLLTCVLNFPEEFPTDIPPSGENNPPYISQEYKKIYAKARLLSKALPQSKTIKNSPTQQELSFPIKLDEQENTLDEWPDVILSFSTDSLFQKNANSEELFIPIEAPKSSESKLSDWITAQEKNADDLYKKSLSHIREDMQHVTKQSIYSLSKKTTTTIEKLLAPKNSAEKLKLIEAELIEWANRPPEISVERAKQNLLEQGNIRKVISLEELIVLFARKDTQALHKVIKSVVCWFLGRQTKSI